MSQIADGSPSDGHEALEMKNGGRGVLLPACRRAARAAGILGGGVSAQRRPSRRRPGRRRDPAGSRAERLRVFDDQYGAA